MQWTILFVIFVSSATAFAQMDPSSALLLKQDEAPSTTAGGLDSGRYTIKQPAPAQPHAQTEQAPHKLPTRLPQVKHEPVMQNQSPDPAAQPVVVVNPEPGSFLAGAGAPVTPPPPLTEVVMGGSNDEVEQYKQMLDQNDRRNNLLELSIAPAYIYNNSSSPYLFRDYTVASPALSAEGHVWLTPFFGFQASHMATLGGSLRDSFTTSNFVSVAQSWTRIGVRSRSFLTTGRNSPSLTWGIGAYDYHLRVPADSNNRGRLSTSGAEISLDGEWPISGKTSWFVGMTFLPKAHHREYSTNLQLRSGQHVDTNGVGLSLGTRVQFDRSSAMFLRLSHQLEKHIFTGEADVADPRTGVKPTGVPVTNSVTSIQLGYTWGN